MTTADHAPRRVGMPMLGPYRLVEELGTGGMGVVHLALDRGGRAVALKVLRPHVADDAEARARLEREVETLSRITDPRVAPIIDADLHGPRPYLVTRFVPGPSLDELVGDSGPLDGTALLRVARGLAQALKSIHAAGVVHRDVKPSNVLLDDEGDPVLIDFGIAHLTDDVRITLTGLVMGTPGYLSPEVINGGAVTHATDWWGWAATLAFAASGSAPFGRGPMEAVLGRVRLGEHDLSGVDPRLAPLLAAALTVDPDRRPHADDVLLALERYAAGADATVVVPAPERAAVTQPVGSGAASTGAAVTQPVAAGVTQPVSPSTTRALPKPPAPSPQKVSAPAPAASSAATPVPPPRLPPRPAAAPPPWAGPSTSPGAPGSTGSAAGAAYPPVVTRPGGATPLPTGPYVDPRIARSPRTGTVLALGALLVAGAAAWPAVAVCVAALLRWVAAVDDRVVTSLVVRRHTRGVRPSDVTLAVVRSPWHVVVGALSAAAALVLPAVMGVATAFCVALATQLATGAASEPDRPLPLAVGMAAALVMGWIGPGGTSLRRGTRSLLRGVAPDGVGRNAVVLLLLFLAAALVGWMLVGGGAVHWWPLTRSPWAALVG